MDKQLIVTINLTEEGAFSYGYGGILYHFLLW